MVGVQQHRINSGFEADTSTVPIQSAYIGSFRDLKDGSYIRAVPTCPHHEKIDL